MVESNESSNSRSNPDEESRCSSTSCVTTDQLPIPDMNLASLRQLVEAAEERKIRTFLSALLSKLRKAYNKAIDNRQGNIVIAQKVLSCAASLAETSASEGNSSVPIYRLDRSEFEIAAGQPIRAELDPTCLKEYSAGFFIFSNCTKAGLKPTLEWWRDNAGPDFGYEIVIHW